MKIPNQEKILKRMAENAAKGAVRVQPGSEFWIKAIAELEAKGIEHAQPGVFERMLAALIRGELWLWKLSDGGCHITEPGFAPGNQSLS